MIHSILEYAAAVFIVAELGFALFTLYRNGPVRRRYGRRMAGVDYQPSCSVIVPTKGLPADAELNFSAYLGQDYDKYRVYFVVESEEDEGVPVLRRCIDEHGRGELVVAGLTESACQQNHNMLAGARLATDSEVIVFADNDIAPKADWLERLIRPLADERITVATAYRWLRGRTGSLAEHTHAFMNMTLYAHFSVVSSLLGTVLWGGSFALRRHDFDTLNIAARWNETVSDDMSLAEILAKNRRKSYLIPGFLIVSDDLFGSTGKAVSWFSRQILNVKACQYPLWLFVLIPALLTALGIYLLLPAALMVMLTGIGGFREYGGVAAIIFILGDMLVCFLSGLPGPAAKRGLMVLRTPYLRMAQYAGLLKSIGKHSLVWAGIEYRFDRDGRITGIRR